MSVSRAVDSISSSSVSRAAARSTTARACRIADSAAFASAASASSSSESCCSPRLLDPQFPLEVAQGQVVEIEAALTGTYQVGREGGVAGDPGQRPAAASQCVQGGLRLVQRLGHRRVAQPAGQRRLVLGREGRGVHVRPLPVGRGDRHGRGVTAVRNAGPEHGDPVPRTRPGMLGQPPGERARLEHAAAHLEALLGLGFDRAERREQPVAQHLELEVVEQPVDAVAVPGSQRQLVGGCRAGSCPAPSR